MATRTNPILGRHSTLRISADSKPIRVFTITSFRADEDAELSAGAFLGEPTKTSYREHNGWEGSFDLEVASKDWHDLEDQVIGRDKARLTPSNISVLYIETYRDGTTASWTYQACALKFGHEASGRQDKVKKKVSFRSDVRVPNQ